MGLGGWGWRLGGGPNTAGGSCFPSSSVVSGVSQTDGRMSRAGVDCGKVEGRDAGRPYLSLSSLSMGSFPERQRGHAPPVDGHASGTAPL